MRVTRTITVEQKGVGKPDYSKYISSGRERAGLVLEYNQTLKLFAYVASDIASPYNYFDDPLPAEAERHYIDTETGLEMPFTVPEGYTLAEITFHSKSNQDRMVDVYYDGDYLGMAQTIEAGELTYLNDVISMGTILFDPTGAAEHTWDLVFRNIGGADLIGGGFYYFVLSKVGSKPLPENKVVKCKYCGNTGTIPNSATQWLCSKCGKLNKYLSLQGYRGS